MTDKETAVAAYKQHARHIVTKATRKSTLYDVHCPTMRHDLLGISNPSDLICPDCGRVYGADEQCCNFTIKNHGA